MLNKRFKVPRKLFMVPNKRFLLINKSIMAQKEGTVGQIHMRFIVPTIVSNSGKEGQS